ncbi:hypothetical protein V6N12_008682 [Hibiscus sabdariffa]|uniref:Uncharacterized protein n=1 Tax=Hibiscus sabdariffa TaxID=183260 RepID=A0ABR2ASQ4_9ROSI
MVERDQDGEDVVVKDGAITEDDSMGINESLYVLQASPKIKAELEGDGISVMKLSTSPLTWSSASVVETIAEPREASTVNTL